MPCCSFSSSSGRPARLRSSRITVTTMRVTDMSRSLSSSWATRLRRPRRTPETPPYTATTEGASMRKMLATPACMAVSSQRPSLASCWASEQAWNNPARASTRSSFMPRVSNTDLRFLELRCGGEGEGWQQAAVGGIGCHDHRAAETDLASVENDRLTRRDGTLRHIERDGKTGLADADRARLVGLTVARARRAAKLGARRLAGDPVWCLGMQSPRQQPVVLAALGDDQHVGRHVLAHHEPRLAAGAMPAADAESVALAQGVIHHPLVFADPPAVGRAHLARACGNVPRQEAAEVALADEADAGGILLRMGRQRRLAGQFAHARLLDPAQRKQRGGQLLLAQRMQEITLVLGRVRRPQQPVASVHAIDAGVMAGGDLFRAEHASLVEEGLELDLAIAQHVRIGCAAGAVFGKKVLEHAIPVLRREVARVERDAQAATDRHRVLAVRVAGARTVAVVLFPVLHEQAFDLVALPLQQQGSHRRIDTAGDAQHHLHPRDPPGTQLRLANGSRWPASQASMLASTSGLRRRSPRPAISSRVIHKARRIPVSSGRSASCPSARAAKLKRITASPCSLLRHCCT